MTTAVSKTISEVTWHEVRQALSAPFAVDELEWTVTRSTKDKSKNAWGAYVDARAVMDRLDDVCGIGNWHDQYAANPHGEGLMCGLTIRLGDEEVTKWDGAESGDTEAIKAAFSRAFRRAAVKWGIGRYLYSVEPVWLPSDVPSWDAAKLCVKHLQGDQQPTSLPRAREERQNRPKGPGQSPATPGTAVSLPAGWEEGLRERMDAAGISMLDLSEYLTCPVDEVMVEAAFWVRQEKATAADLLKRVKSAIERHARKE
jgi:hypothetical protein